MDRIQKKNQRDTSEEKDGGSGEGGEVKGGGRAENQQIEGEKKAEKRIEDWRQTQHDQGAEREKEGKVGQSEGG